MAMFDEEAFNSDPSLGLDALAKEGQTALGNPLLSAIQRYQAFQRQGQQGEAPAPTTQPIAPLSADSFGNPLGILQEQKPKKTTDEEELSSLYNQLF